MARKDGDEPVMDLKFEWDGETFALCQDADKWTLGEMRAVERWIGLPIDSMSQLDQMSAAIGVSIKRARPQFRLVQADDVPMEVIRDMMEQAEAAKKAQEEAGPTEPAEDAAAEDQTP